MYPSDSLQLVSDHSPYNLGLIDAHEPDPGAPLAQFE
jgi:hypothetical protein